MLVQDGASSGSILDREVQMFKQATVTASHVADAFRLLVDRAVEDFHDDFVHFLEIRVVSAAAAPYVHSAVDQELDAGLVDARDPRIAEQERAAGR